MEFLCEPQQSMLDVLRDNSAPDRHQGRLRDRRLRRLFGVVGRPTVCSCLMLAVESGGRQITTIEGIARGEAAASDPAEIPANTPHCSAASARRASSSQRRHCSTRIPNPTEDRDPLLPGGQSLPLHRLRQDHPRGSGRRADAARRGIVSEARDFKVIGTRVSPPRRRRQSHRARELRRRLQPARHAVRQGAAQSARARAHQDDRHDRRRCDRRRVRGRHRRRLSRRSATKRSPAAKAAATSPTSPRNVMARDKVAVSRPRGRGGGGQSSAIADAALAAIKVEYEVLHARDGPRRRDGRRRDAAGRTTVHRRPAGKTDEAEQRRGVHGIQARRYRAGLRGSRRGRRRRRIARRPCIRATSSRTPASRRSTRVVRRRSGAARRATSTCAR